jgi:hypothetical protein
LIEFLKIAEDILTDPKKMRKLIKKHKDLYRSLYDEIRKKV